MQYEMQSLRSEEKKGIKMNKSLQAVLSRYYSLINSWLKEQIGSTRNPSGLISSKYPEIGDSLTLPRRDHIF
jgi:hypothetical protein